MYIKTVDFLSAYFIKDDRQIKTLSIIFKEICLQENLMLK